MRSVHQRRRGLPVAIAMAAAALVSVQPVQAQMDSQGFDFVLTGPEEVAIPGDNPWGLTHFPDGPISYTHVDGEMRAWFSATGTVLFRGDSLENLRPYPLDERGAVRVFGPSGTGFDSDYAGAYSVLHASNGSDLLMFYHAESHPCNTWTPFWSGIGLARSTDGGITWTREGEVLSTAAPRPDDCAFLAWNVGNPTVFRSLDGRYLYMLFAEWLHGDPVARPDVLYLARAPVESDGAPGSWSKYADGSFSEPGFGGLGTPVIGQPPPSPFQTVWAGLPSVSFNRALNRYLVIFQSRLGFHVSTSSDGIDWDVPRLVWEGADITRGISDNVEWMAYPSLLSMDDYPSQDTTGATGHLYFARGYPGGDPPHYLARRPFEIRIHTDSEAQPSGSLPKAPHLDEPFPNPFSDEAIVRYFLPAPGSVSVTLFDSLGRTARRVTQGMRGSGWHEERLHGGDLPAGVYHLILQADAHRLERRVVVIH